MSKIQREDWPAIVGSLILATVIWFFDALNRADYITDIDYPLFITHTHENIIAIRDLPEDIPLLVEGNGWDLLKFKLGIEVQALVVSIPHPLQTPAITFEELRLQLNERLGKLRILQGLQDSLFLSFDTLLTVTRPVKIVDPAPWLATNYRRISPIQLSPATVEVRLPRTMLDQLTDTIFIQMTREEIDDTFSDRIPFEKQKSNLFRHPYVRLNPEGVRVSFEVDLFLEQVYDLPVRTVNFPDTLWQLSDSSVRMSYWIRRSDELLVRDDSLFVLLDFEQLNPLDSSLNYQLPDLPDHYVTPQFSPSECIQIKRQL
ncbi:MAG: hypothetical protein ACFCUI_06755 [Bernardetiaceae bacterium]